MVDMKQALQLTGQYFESSSGRTPEYLQWFRCFKREFTKFLTEQGASKVSIGKPNHFDMSGFFTINHQCWYFSISDLRWSKDSMLIRTAKDERDFTGGPNQYISLDNLSDFIRNFKGIVLK